MEEISKEEAIHRFGEVGEFGEFGLNDVPYLKDDNDVVLAAVKKNGLNIQYASVRLQETPPIVYAALRQNGLVYKVLTPQIKTALQAIKLAYSLAPEILEFVPDDVWGSSKFLQWVISIPNAIVPNRHKKNLNSYRYVFQHVEVPQIRSPAEFTQDCVCFIKGHSMFAPSVPVPMNEDMKHKTLLISDPCDVCMLFQEKSITSINELFLQPEILVMSAEELLERVNTLTKEQSGLEEYYKSRGPVLSQTANIFIKSKGYISTDETTFINRTWKFTDKEIGKPDKPAGFILLSYMRNGEMIKERLFIENIDTSTFKLSKKELFDFLYEKGFRNVILIDGGCNMANTCSPEMITSLREGRFGGKSKSKRRKSKRKSKKSKKH
jgi:hypothetical protein